VTKNFLEQKLKVKNFRAQFHVKIEMIVNFVYYFSVSAPRVLKYRMKLNNYS